MSSRGQKGRRLVRARTGSKEVELRVGDERPEAIVLPSEGLDGRPLAHVPHANGLVLGCRQDELVPGVEERHRDVVEVAAAGVDLPGLGVRHTPELDLSVVGTRDNKRKGGVEGGPAATASMSARTGARERARIDQNALDSTVVTLEDVFDDGVGAAEEVGLTAVGALDLLLERHGLMGGALLAQTRDVPDADREVHRGRNDEVLLRMELGGPERAQRRGKR